MDCLRTDVFGGAFFHQVHADSSTFAENVTKEEALRQVLEEAEGLCEGQRNWVCFLLLG